ncbi:hypothetical protein BDA99DRAFT_536021 [Phascolomyces articulosus]|uniref:F-box domain-containing protein n=1 Tax=Phascolomyces articulosus TaxID=60185 RepID=A0AAD5K2Q7_9FUNG|nr:hypothetical protein BDA99DRAFT_536021 [Phascolomyces articulosus]
MTEIVSRKRKWPLPNQSAGRKRSLNDKRLDFTKALLSNELVLHIFSYLSASELAQCAKVNSSWYRLANDDLLWKLLFLRRFRYPLMVDMKEDPKLLQRWQERTTHNNDFNTNNNNIKRKRSEWKIVYKTNHNWRLGNCRMTYVDVDEEDEKMSSITNKSITTNTTSSYVQFANDVLYIAYTTAPLIEVWKLKNSGQPTMLRQLETTAPTTEKITCLKLDTSSSGTHRLVAGYTGGGLSVWEITWNNSSSNLNDGSSSSNSMSCSATEVAVYTPRTMRTDCIISIGISYPMIITCSSPCSTTTTTGSSGIYTPTDMRLSAFCIDISSRTGQQAARLVYELRSYIHWNPMSIEIDPCNGEINRWRAMVCFGMPVGLNSYTVGIQEIIISKESLISSRHCTALNEEDLFFAPSSSSSSDHTANTSITEYSQQPITSISYSEPYLITAHANNTIKQYYVRFADNKLELIFAQTLYGHTSKVSALALDSSIGRLVSGDRFGLKIWDFHFMNKDKVLHDDPSIHSDDHASYYQRRHIAGTEYIVSIDGHEDLLMGNDDSMGVPFRDIEWLQFDSDKIVAVVRDERKKDSNHEKLSVRIWSFSEDAI